MENKREVYGIVYIATSPKDKSYVGQTTQKFEDRMWQHGNSAEKFKDECPKFCRAIRKHKWENFTKQVVAEAYSKDELNELEAYFIEKHNSITNGYNIREGGSTATINEETKQKMSDSRRKYTEYDLPMYCSYYVKDDEICGFRCVKPDCEPVILCDSSTMEEKYELILTVHLMTAEEIKQFNKERKALKNKKNKRDAGEGFPLYDYLSYNPKYETFSVRVPKTSEKKFGKKFGDKRARYEAALKHLHETIERMQFRD
jgi:group I intron endonuclease